MKHFNHILIFVAGVLCSVGVLHIVQRVAVKPKRFNPLPSDLQVREDFHVGIGMRKNPFMKFDETIDTVPNICSPSPVSQSLTFSHISISRCCDIQADPMTIASAMPCPPVSWKPSTPSAWPLRCDWRAKRTRPYASINMPSH